MGISKGVLRDPHVRSFCQALALLGIVVALGWRALLSLGRLAFSDPEYSHILLIAPIVVAFLLFETNTKKANEPLHRGVGVILGIAAAVFGFLVRFSPENLTLSVFAIVLATWAVVILIYGWSFFRAALFPMMFLLLLVPWPSAVVERLTTLLQAGSTSAAYWLFRVFGVPVTRQGFVLSLSSIDIEVAKECSGIRSTIMLGLTALVLGQWYLRSGWRKALLVLAVFPIGILRNGLRIFILSILGVYVNEGWLDGNLHHRGGAVFFVLGLAFVVTLLWFLRNHEPRRGLAEVGRTGFTVQKR